MDVPYPVKVRGPERDHHGDDRKIRMRRNRLRTGDGGYHVHVPLRWDDNPASLTDTGRLGRNMNTNESEYALEPTTFRSMQEVQELTDTLEENLHGQVMGNPSIRPELVEMFSQLVNNAAEHGMTP